MKVGIPELNRGLVFPPPLVHQKTEHNAGPVIGPSSFLGGLYYLLGNDLAMGPRDLFLLQLARHALLDKVSESQRNLGHVRRGNGGLDGLVIVGWKDFATPSSNPWLAKYQLVDPQHSSCIGDYSRR